MQSSLARCTLNSCLQARAITPDQLRLYGEALGPGFCEDASLPGVEAVLVIGKYAG